MTCGNKCNKRCLCQPRCPKPICRIDNCGCGCKKERRVRCACTPCFNSCGNGGFGGFGFGSCGGFRRGSCGGGFLL